MRTLAAVLLLALPFAASGSPADAALVHVRVEGAWEHLWSGAVTLEGTYALTAGNSGRTYALDARTPLGALVAAAREGGFSLDVSDEFSDFVVLAIAGDAWFGAHWWDYRVDWVEPNYGPQQQWLAWRPPLADGTEVLWYLDAIGTTPLRLAPLAGAAGPPCAQLARVDRPAVDTVHQPGQPWPQPVWGPVPAARLAGAVQGPVVAGAGLGFGAAGAFWAEEQPLPLAPLVHYIRSPLTTTTCA